MNLNKSTIIGCFLAFLSAVSYASAGMFFKLIRGMFFAQTIIYRMVITTAVLIPIAARCSPQDVFGDWDQIKWVTVIAIAQAITSPVKFVAISLMPYADLYALILSGVMLLTLAVGKFWLKETCGMFETLTASVIMLGMVFVTEPLEMINFFTSDYNNENSTLVEGMWDDFNSTEVNYKDASKEGSENYEFRMIGIGLALLECILNACSVLCARRIQVHYSIINLHIAGWTLVICTALTIFFGHFSLPTADQWLPLTGFALAGTIFNFSYFQALIFEQAGVVCTVRTVEIPVSYALQAIFLQTFPTLLVSIGSSIITIATVTFGVVTWIREKKPKSEYDEFPEIENK